MATPLALAKAPTGRGPLRKKMSTRHARTRPGIAHEAAAGRSMIRILIVDDHPLVREGLKRILAAMVGVVVVGEAATGEEAVARARDLDPNLVIMDLSLP